MQNNTEQGTGIHNAEQRILYVVGVTHQQRTTYWDGRVMPN
jgi:hypothetical protein